MNIVDFDLFSSIFRAAAENEDAFDYASYHDSYAFVVTKKTGKDLIGISIANRATDNKNDDDYFEAVIFLSENAPKRLPDDEDEIEAIVNRGWIIWDDIVSVSTSLSLQNLGMDLLSGFRIACRALELGKKEGKR